ncbi:MAG TPA: type II toxin-antitoxin system prevent-host-death family antitoxin [Devosia sp.]|nr:type II toxin-antitoxin system prevent-host-death family antitoxin [Devosia sp.]
MTTVNMLEAKTKLSKLVEAVESGAESEIILARNGKPVARIVPLGAEPALRPQRLGIAEGEFGDLSPEALAEWDKQTADIWSEWEKSPLIPEAPARAPRTRKRA